MQETQGLIPGSGRSPGEGNGNSLQHSCLQNPMDRGAWPASPWGCRAGRDWAQHERSNIAFRMCLSVWYASSRRLSFPPQDWIRSPTHMALPALCSAGRSIYLSVFPTMWNGGFVHHQTSHVAADILQDLQKCFIWMTVKVCFSSF